MASLEEYSPAHVERKWQQHWQQQHAFRTAEHPDKPKFYVLDMFPYPSGDGLHVGHVEGYTATDIIARFKRMRGFNVLHPMGWDAFGLPAEQYAIKTGTHPAQTTARNVKRFREQLTALGFSYDWEREINTTDPAYYRWTQWIFQQLFKQGLAYQSEEFVNFCPKLGTVLANEEVIDGKSEVGGFEVIKKPMRQWVLKITAYAERLLADLDALDWPESVKEMQRNWIGKSYGAEIEFKLADDNDASFTVFSTRPDTLFGATFCVLAPEHPLVERVCSPAQRNAVDAYVQEALRTSERDRAAAGDKHGVFSGGYALNPVNNEHVPIYIASYVLMSYGHGAIMAVPAHDERDHQFARLHDLPIRCVITGGDVDIMQEAWTGDGVCINSQFLDGLSSSAAITAMCDWLEQHKCGRHTVNYKLRDWLFARQRYWGEPFPLFHDHEGKAVLVDENELPVLLPDLLDFRPGETGESPLSRCEEFMVYDKDGKRGRRESNTMPQWAGSCWYYLRFIDPHNTQQAWDKHKEQRWLPVDLYVGGVEHAVLHLLYARFWHKVLFDLGHVSTTEPFQRLVNQGTILGTNGEKMSKSRGNVINPDDVIAQWGADSLRLYEMFMGPLEATKPWQTNGIIGCQRFLKKVWRFFTTTEFADNDKSMSMPLKRALHRLIREVTDDTEKLRFNTAIAHMMEFMNIATKTTDKFARTEMEKFLLLLAPYAPHICEELWQRLGHEQSLTQATWPAFDPALASEEQVTLSIQVNGRHRCAVQVDKDCVQDKVEELALVNSSVRNALAERKIVKKIFVKNKILNFVISS